VRGSPTPPATGARYGYLADLPPVTSTPGTALRIVQGKFAGRTLTSPNDFRVRPTAEHVRVTLMDMLRGELDGARVLDLFAGTGALGLEAISLGARKADFVETRPASLHALKANIAMFKGVKENTRVFKRDALPFAAALTEGTYDVAFVDPPYGSKMLDRVIQSWEANRFARILAVEHATTHVLPTPNDKRIIADSALSIYRLQSVPT
jgi:16S rRNA (guanine966-N2)-methyltransferase